MKEAYLVSFLPFFFFYDVNILLKKLVMDL